MSERFALVIEAEPDARPPEVRLRMLLKHAGRRLGLRAIEVAPAKMTGPAPGPPEHSGERRRPRELPQGRKQSLCSVTELGCLILEALDAEITHWTAPERAREVYGMSAAGRYAHANARAAARKGLASYRPREWLGRELTTADRKAVSRTVSELAEAGFLLRFGDTRTTEVALLALPVDWGRK